MRPEPVPPHQHEFVQLWALPYHDCARCGQHYLYAWWHWLTTFHRPRAGTAYVCYCGARQIFSREGVSSW